MKRAIVDEDVGSVYVVCWEDGIVVSRVVVGKQKKLVLQSGSVVRRVYSEFDKKDFVYSA
jgi:hypothetical protein